MSAEWIALFLAATLLLLLSCRLFRRRTSGWGLRRPDCLWQSLPREASLFMNSARLGLWCYEPAGDAMTLDDRARQLLGAAEDLISKAGLLARVHPEDQETLRQAWENCCRQGGALAMEFRALGEDGLCRHLSLSAHALNPLSCRGCQGPVIRGTLQDVSEQRRLENSLRESESRFSAVFQASPAGVGISRLEDGVLVDANPAFLEILGLPREEVLGVSSSDLRLWASPEERRSVIETLLEAGRSYSGEHRLRRRDGQWRHLLGSVDIVCLDGAQHLLWVLLDVTELRHSAALINRSENLTQAVMDSLPVAVAVLDRLGHILRVNRKWSEFALDNGAPGRLQQGEGLNYFEICLRTFPEESAREALEAMQAVLAGKVAVASIEYHCENPVRERWFLLQVSALGKGDEGIEGLVTIHVDITARRQAEAVLQQRLELQSQLAKVADSVPGVIFSLRRRPDGRYCMPYALRGLKDILGVEPEAVVEDFAPALGMLHPEDRPRVIDTVEASARDMSPWFCEFRVLHPEHGLRWVEGRSIPCAEAEGGVLWHGFIHDITARKQANEEIMQSRDQLRALTERLQSVREEERTRISREIHDQLGQNLTILKLDVQCLRHGLQPEQEELAAKVAAMGSLIDETLKTVRTISWDLRPGILDTLGLGAGIEWLVDDFRRRLGIRCTVTVPEERLELNDCLATHLFRICQELLTNVARHARASRVEVSLACNAEGVLLEVCDNGLGMAALPANGHSLGLLGVRERAVQCGGVVEIATVPEISGTRVRVQIPVTGVEKETR